MAIHPTGNPAFDAAVRAAEAARQLTVNVAGTTQAQHAAAHVAYAKAVVAAAAASGGAVSSPNSQEMLQELRSIGSPGA